MERRLGSRAQVDLPVNVLVDGFRHRCRAVDLSANGMVFEPSRVLSQRSIGLLNAFELMMLGQKPIRARARSVWSRDGLYAVRFVTMHDVDRLVIAEHLDRIARLREQLH